MITVRLPSNLSQELASLVVIDGTGGADVFVMVTRPVEVDPVASLTVTVYSAGLKEVKFPSLVDRPDIW